MKTKRTNQKNRSTFVQVIKTTFGLKQITHKRGVISQEAMQLPTIPYEPSEKTLKRKRDRDRSVLVYNPQELDPNGSVMTPRGRVKGPYVRAKHGELV